MASVLFRGDYPKDALALASMALDMSGETAATYTLMGFMLAVCHIILCSKSVFMLQETVSVHIEI